MNLHNKLKPLMVIVSALCIFALPGFLASKENEKPVGKRFSGKITRDFSKLKLSKKPLSIYDRMEEWVNLDEPEGQSIQFADRDLKMRYTKEDFIEAWSNVKTSWNRAIMQSLAYDGHVVTQNDQVLVIWTASDTQGFKYLMVENFGTEWVTLELEIEYTSKEDREIGNRISVPAGLIEPGHVNAYLVTAMGLGGDEFNLYKIDWDESGTGDPTRTLIGSYTWD